MEKSQNARDMLSDYNNYYIGCQGDLSMRQFDLMGNNKKL